MTTRSEKSYELGDRPEVTATIRNISNALTNPTKITVTVRKPDGTQSSYDQDHVAVNNGSVGVWTFVFQTSLDQVGDWSVKWYATETLIAAEEYIFSVDKSKVGLPA